MARLSLASNDEEPGFVLVENKTSGTRASLPSAGGLAISAGVSSAPMLGRGRAKRVKKGYRGKVVARGAGRNQSRAPSLPPVVNVTHVFFAQTYYTNTSAVNTAVSLNSLVMSAGAICTAANATLTGWAGAIKLKRIIIWTAVANGTSSTWGFVEWSTGVSSLTKDEQKLRPIPEGTSNTAPVVCVPPPESYQSEWIAAGSSTSNVFNISTNVGSVVLVEMAVAMSNVVNPTTQTVATATLGTVYYPYLDGVTTHRYAPIGLLSTF